MHALHARPASLPRDDVGPTPTDQQGAARFNHAAVESAADPDMPELCGSEDEMEPGGAEGEHPRPDFEQSAPHFAAVAAWRNGTGQAADPHQGVAATRQGRKRFFDDT